VPSRNKRGERLRQIPGMTPNLLALPQGCAFRMRCTNADTSCEIEPQVVPTNGRELRCFHPMDQAA